MKRKEQKVEEAEKVGEGHMLKNAELGRAVEALKALSAERLPVIGALRVRKLTRAVAEHLEDVEGVRKGLLERYGQKGEDGKLIVEGNAVPLIPETMLEFQAEFAALMAGEWSTEYSLRVSDLGKGDIAPQVLIDLGGLLDEGAE
jgi:hypothetical protein